MRKVTPIERTLVCPPSPQWCELRDQGGKLYARLELQHWLLEIKRNDRDAVATFDLRALLVERAGESI